MIYNFPKTKLKSPGFYPIHSMYEQRLRKVKMSASYSFEKTCSKIASMSKREVIRGLLNFDGPIKMDFSVDYLEKLSTDRLRHILLAAFVTVDRKHAS